MNQNEQSIAVIGGTGQLGAAIARRLAKAGRPVIIGSRDPIKAEAAARQLGAELGCEVAFGGNVAAAGAAQIVILTVPFASQRTTLEDIRSSVLGKIVIDTTVPLMPPKVMRVQLPPEGSAAQRAQDILGEEVRVVSAFHNVAAHKLITDAIVDCDVLVFGDDKAAREVAVSLVDACGLRGLHGGALANSAAAEAMTSVLIFLNKNYSADGAGVRITGQLTVPAAR
ncbi:MAG: NADPH-dependent reductase [Pseudomonadota bacterium]